MIRRGAALVLLVACGGTGHSTAPPPPASSAPTLDAAVPSASASASLVDAGPPAWVGKTFAFPHATAPVSLDYIVYERSQGRVWIPIMTTGTVAVFDIATATFSDVAGFKTEERPGKDNKKRVVGPSAASVGDGVVYVGNRATSEICPVDIKTQKTGACLKLTGSPDGVAYVASAKEVWVTTPHDQSIVAIDASKPGALKQKAVIKTDGAPEGYAVHDTFGLFYTNTEDKGATLAIDVKTHAVKLGARYLFNPGCGPDGPRGLVVDAAGGYIVVACTDHLQVIENSHDNEGAPLGKLDTGAGVDNIDFLPSKRLIYAAAGKDGKLTVAHLDEKGQLSLVATAATSPGARNAVADDAGNVYVPDAQAARLFVFPAPH